MKPVSDRSCAEPQTVGASIRRRVFARLFVTLIAVVVLAAIVIAIFVDSGG